jgi:hypothetical protein
VSRFIEKNEGVLKLQLPEPSATYITFSLILDFIYSGDTSSLLLTDYSGWYRALDVFVIADYLGIEKLMVECGSYLSSVEMMNHLKEPNHRADLTFPRCIVSNILKYCNIPISVTDRVI